MPQIDVPLVRGRFGATSRPDNWWIQPLAVFLGFSAFIVYSTWAALQGKNYMAGPLLSPMYSPLIFGPESVAWIHGTGVPSWFPSFLPFSAAMLVLWAPGGFRFTCYYYRGAYYKAFWADPVSCAVGEPRKSFLGENSFPLIMQNIHRYFLYFALAFLVLLTYDLWLAIWFQVDAAGKTYADNKEHFGIGLGTLIMILNVVLLSSYTLGCHSLRHLVGGKKDEISKSKVCKKSYDCVSCLNRRHMLFAWCSLFCVGFTDVYIRLCAMGIWHDWRII